MIVDLPVGLLFHATRKKGSSLIRVMYFRDGKTVKRLKKLFPGCVCVPIKSRDATILVLSNKNDFDIHVGDPECITR